MRRREFIPLLGGAAASWPLVAVGQQASRLVRIGFLSGGAGPNPNVYGFQHGLRQLGYVEGLNLVLIYRWAAAQRAPIVDLARELLELNVDVLASHTTEAIAAIRSLNTAIPVVDGHFRPNRQWLGGELRATRRQHDGSHPLLQ